MAGLFRICGNSGTDLAQELYEWAVLIANPPKRTIPAVRDSLELGCRPISGIYLLSFGTVAGLRQAKLFVAREWVDLPGSGHRNDKNAGEPQGTALQSDHCILQDKRDNQLPALWEIGCFSGTHLVFSCSTDSGNQATEICGFTGRPRMASSYTDADEPAWDRRSTSGNSNRDSLNSLKNHLAHVADLGASMMHATANRSSIISNPWDAPAAGPLSDPFDGLPSDNSSDSNGASDLSPQSHVSLPPSLFQQRSLLDNTRPLISTADSSVSLGLHNHNQLSTSSLDDYVSPSDAAAAARSATSTLTTTSITPTTSAAAADDPDPDPWSATIPKLDDALKPGSNVGGSTLMDHNSVEQLMKEAAAARRRRQQQQQQQHGDRHRRRNGSGSSGDDDDNDDDDGEGEDATLGFSKSASNVEVIKDEGLDVPPVVDPSAIEVEHVKVLLAPEKGGIVFKHVNYILHSQTRQTSVLRRYSDFLWLLDVLVRKYPFRTIPSLPPKKVGADPPFLERRRRALSRFINLVVNHPTLGEDESVIAFLTVEMDIHAYRKKVTVSTEEEVPQQTPRIMASIPGDLAERIVEFKKGLDFLICQYRDLATLTERIARREDDSAVDLMRFSLIVNGLSEKASCTSPTCHSCLRTHHGLLQISGGLKHTSVVMAEESQCMLDGILESLKTHRDLLIACQELFYRQERALSALTLDALNKRILTLQTKLHDVTTKGGGGGATTAASAANNTTTTTTSTTTTNSKEADRLKAAIEADQREVERQGRRIDVIRLCTWRELQYYHKQQAFVSLMYQQFVSEKMRLSSSYSEIWRTLAPAVFELPTAEFANL
ncbi:Sorting nexin mvp1 [Geranomyces michiganensis]|nr:Sorting nexin mvp1 [Geranomyces michiganensis]